MGADQKFYIQGEDGSFRRLNEEYAITIHFETKEEMDDFIELLKKFNDLKMELTGQQEDPDGQQENV